MEKWRVNWVKECIEREFILFVEEEDIHVQNLFYHSLEGMVEVAFKAAIISEKEFKWLSKATREIFYM